jgi:hypothetical protein
MLSAVFLGTKVSALDLFAVCLVISAVSLPALVQLRRSAQAKSRG